MWINFINVGEVFFLFLKRYSILSLYLLVSYILPSLLLTCQGITYTLIFSLGGIQWCQMVLKMSFSLRQPPQPTLCTPIPLIVTGVSECLLFKLTFQCQWTFLCLNAFFFLLQHIQSE